ncbi:nitroreductase family protein [Rhodotorula paludigena]|uniref:nitroreductase family protein n=1 Tax=Rhodotorula paludigena TaxID=86838 RepID=UPI0031783FB3
MSATFAAPNEKPGAGAFLEAVKARRTIYALSKDSPIPDERIIEIVNEAVKHCPSSFNSQSSRAVVLLGAHHDKLWDFAKAAIKAVVPAEAYSASEQRLNGFQNGHGTVLFFEDEAVVKGLQDAMPTYAAHFPAWSEHAHGLLAFTVWTALEAEGLGANLQHYSPLIDADVSREFSTPESWKLKAQLVFGTPTAPAGPKEFKPLEERVKVFQ